MTDWMYKIRKEPSQKTFFKIFYFNNKVTRTIKGSQKLSNKEIYFTLQSNNTKSSPLNLFHDQI